MAPLLVLVHTVPPLVWDFSELCAQVLPGVRLEHVLDEPLLESIRRHGMATPEDNDRLANHVHIAAELGASAVLVTCSTLSLSVDAIRDRFRVPIIRIDDAMAVEAVRLGGQITIVATNPTTFEASQQLIENEAARVGAKVSVRLRPVAGALAALLNHEPAMHDRLVGLAVREEAGRSDVIVLAQASMARAIAAMTGSPVSVPVLASPRLALAEVRRALGDIAVGATEVSEERP